MFDLVPSRRGFLKSLAGVFMVFSTPRFASAAMLSGRAEHPEPRPGIDASRVLKKEELGNDAEIIELFDHVRTIPQIVDGIRCPCGCANEPGNYSLLSCYETGMARFCEICQACGRIAYERHAKGDSLKDIRRHIDGAFN